MGWIIGLSKIRFSNCELNQTKLEYKYCYSTFRNLIQSLIKKEITAKISLTAEYQNVETIL